MRTTFIITACLGMLSSTYGQSVNWGNTPGDENYDSSGQRLTAKAYQFELGLFKDGFQPLEANVSEWLENWIPVDNADYNEPVGYFSSTWKADSELGGKQAFILIHRKLDQTGSMEFFLATSAAWKVPSLAGGPAQMPTEWRLSTATTVISGASPKLAAAAIELQRFETAAEKSKAVVALVTGMAGFLVFRTRRSGHR